MRPAEASKRMPSLRSRRSTHGGGRHECACSRKSDHRLPCVELSRSDPGNRCCLVVYTTARKRSLRNPAASFAAAADMLHNRETRGAFRRQHCATEFRGSPQLKSINAERSLLSMRCDSAALARHRGDGARCELEAGDRTVVAAFRSLTPSSMTTPCRACSTS
jgi:hypothetical protein